LAAVKHFIFDEKSISGQELIQALDTDFEGFEDIYQKLRDEAPKIGNNDVRADAMLVLKPARYITCRV
jgi:formate C-acetyltransferase